MVVAYCFPEFLWPKAMPASSEIKISSTSSLDNVRMQITTVKLSGSNYLLWVQTVEMFLGDRGKLR